MTDISRRLSLATTADDAVEVAKEFGLSLELDEFSYSYTLDEPFFSQYLPDTEKKLASAPCGIFHAPFCELIPASCEPLVVQVAKKRLDQAHDLCARYGVKRMVVHTGFIPIILFKSWHLERSILFWKDYLSDKADDFTIYIENVLEDEPYMLAELIDAIDDPRAMACFDVGHANCMSKLSLDEWAKALGKRIGHVHIHQNDGVFDHHYTLDKGEIDMLGAISSIEAAAFSPTYTIENLHCRPSVEWLNKNGLL